MWIALTTTLLMAAGPEVGVTPLGGQTARGSLLRIDANGVAVQTATGERTWAVEQLLAIKPVEPAKVAAEKPAVWLTLIDGSELLATEIVVTKGLARVTLTGSDSIDVPTRSLHAVRLKDHDAELAKTSQLSRQWQDIAAAQPAGDVIVIRKLRAEGAEGEERMLAALDQLEGVLGDITAEKVQFTFDDQAIPVDRAKVEGVIFFHPAGRELPDPLCRVFDAAGSQWNVKSLTLAGDALQFVSTSGVKGEFPISRLQALDYSTGKVVFLSDMEPETSEWTNAFGSADVNANLARLFSPRRDQSFGGEPLMLSGQSYEKGLAIHSRTVLEYRLQGKYSKFLALAGIDDRVRPAGDVVLTVSLDGKKLGEQRIRGKDADAIELNYDIRGGRKLSLLVDFGEGLDVSDRLHLVNARVTK